MSGSTPAYANTVFEGPARVVDGDTLYIGMWLVIHMFICFAVSKTGKLGGACMRISGRVQYMEWWYIMYHWVSLGHD